MTFALAVRPPKTRRSIHNALFDDADAELEAALMSTMLTPGVGIVVDLARFHSSPAKGRIWAKSNKGGISVRHRVAFDRATVVAWCEPSGKGVDDR